MSSGVEMFSSYHEALQALFNSIKMLADETELQIASC